MFETKRHKDYAPLALPPKTDEAERPKNQHGFVAPDGSEWSVIVDIAGAHATTPGTALDNFTVRLTIAPRENGHTKRIDDKPVVRQPHDLPIQEFQLQDVAFDINHLIEDTVALMTERAIVVEAKQTATLSKLAKMGVDISATH